MNHPTTRTYAFLAALLAFGTGRPGETSELVTDFTGGGDPADCDPVCWVPVSRCGGALYTPSPEGLEVRQAEGPIDGLIASDQIFSGEVSIRVRGSLNGTTPRHGEVTCPGIRAGVHGREEDCSGYYGVLCFDGVVGLLKFRSGAIVAGQESHAGVDFTEGDVELEVSVVGDRVQVRAWKAGEERPEDAQAVLVDDEYQSGVAFFGANVTEGNPVLVRSVTIQTPTGTPFHRGDPNASGTADISDAITTFCFLFLGDVAPSCNESADANNDGSIDVSDGVYLLTWIFAGGPEPPEPGPPGSPCGLDPDPPASAGDLGCESYGRCE